MTTLTEARDIVAREFKAAVDAYNTANSASIPVYYEDVDKAEAGSKTAHFRVFVHMNGGGQETLGSVGKRKFGRVGIVMVQVMTPFGDGFTLADTLGTVARNAFEGVTTPEGVWFRRAAVRNVGKTAGYQQTNVTADFEFTERR